MASYQDVDSNLPSLQDLLIESDQSVYIGIVMASMEKDHTALAHTFASHGYPTIPLSLHDGDDIQENIESALKYLYRVNSKVILITYDNLAAYIPPIASHIDGLDCAIALGHIPNPFPSVVDIRRRFLIRIYSPETAVYNSSEKVDIASHVYDTELLSSLDGNVSFQNPLWNDIYTLIQFL